MNLVILKGNLTRDPELKHIPNGNSMVCNFGLAMNERWTDAQSGEQRESVCYVEVEAWNRQAELVNQYFKKGDEMLISQGSLKLDTWQAEDGSNRQRLKVRLQRFEFTGRPDDNGNGNSNRNSENTQTAETPQTAPPAPTPSSTAVDDDIPF